MMVPILKKRKYMRRIRLCGHQYWIRKVLQVRESALLKKKRTFKKKVINYSLNLQKL